LGQLKCSVVHTLLAIPQICAQGRRVQAVSPATIKHRFPRCQNNGVPRQLSLHSTDIRHWHHHQDAGLRSPSRDALFVFSLCFLSRSRFTRCGRPRNKPPRVSCLIGKSFAPGLEPKVHPQSCPNHNCILLSSTRRRRWLPRAFAPSRLNLNP